MSQPARDDVRFETAGPIATITLDRPDARNAYSDAMIDGLERAFDEAERDDAIRVVILAGAGPVWSAGGDVKLMRQRAGMFAGDAATLRGRYADGIQRVPRRLARFGKPVVAAIHGAAIGAGLDLACMCDLRVAAEDAKFGSTFVKLGLVPGDGGAFFLARTVGFSRALELALTGRIIDAAEALRIGLVHRVVPAGDLETAARALADELAALPPLAVRLTKAACYRAQEMSLESALDLAATYQAIAQTHPEHEAALASQPTRNKPSSTMEP